MGSLCASSSLAIAPKQTNKIIMDIKERILKERSNGNVVISTFEGLIAYNLKEIIEQPVEGLLYDLNRDPATILTFIEDPKWINDYACMQVITALKVQIEELKKLVQ